MSSTVWTGTPFNSTIRSSGRSPAAQAGLRPEDLIVELNGVPVETVDDIQRLMVGELIGAQVHARVLREGSERELDLIPVELVG